VNFRTVTLLALVGIAGCSAPGMVPGGPHAMDRARLRALVKSAAGRTAVPEKLLLAVIATESKGDPSAISASGAAGLMQLMPSTARQYNVANPFDPAQNIDGGSRYLHDLLRRYHGSLKIALAAYNAGPASVDAAKGVPQYAETRAYVARVLASLK
jgi:soluble lytic murein transglycosylase-like protein